MTGYTQEENKGIIHIKMRIIVNDCQEPTQWDASEFLDLNLEICNQKM